MTKHLKPIVTKIAGKYQVTVPPEIRDLFDLREGDLFEWSFDESAEAIRVIPKRAQLLTPQVRSEIDKLRQERFQQAQAAKAAKLREQIAEEQEHSGR